MVLPPIFSERWSQSDHLGAVLPKSSTGLGDPGPQWHVMWLWDWLLVGDHGPWHMGPHTGLPVCPRDRATGFPRATSLQSSLRSAGPARLRFSRLHGGGTARGQGAPGWILRLPSSHSDGAGLSSGPGECVPSVSQSHERVVLTWRSSDASGGLVKGPEEVRWLGLEFQKENILPSLSQHHLPALLPATQTPHHLSWRSLRINLNPKVGDGLHLRLREDPRLRQS